jgi:predicted MFS family arabinose efflux permease
MAAARDHLPPTRSASTIGVLSVSGAAGVGAGYPISTIAAETMGLSAAFWAGAVFSATGLVAAAAIVPPARSSRAVSLDLTGAVLIAIGLTALLLGIGEGNTWGWTSARTLVVTAIAVVGLGVWVARQLHIAAPLVALRLLGQRTVLASYVATFLLSIATFSYVALITGFVQVPSRVGYGLNGSVFMAGLVLVPFSILSVATSRLTTTASRVFKARLIPCGALIVAAAGALFALSHDHLWQAFAVMGIAGIGFGLTFAALPWAIAGALPLEETGSALGLYQVVRYVGFSVGSAVSGAILTAYTSRGDEFPALRGYELSLWIAVASCALAPVVMWLLRARAAAAAPARNPKQVAQAKDAPPLQ